MTVIVVNAVGVVGTSSNADAHIPSIGYDNHFTIGTVTTSSENASYPMENAYDWNESDSFKFDAGTGTHWIRVQLASATSANYYAIHKHNLADVGGTVTPQYSTDGTTWSDSGASYSPSTNNTIMQQFTAVSRVYHRLKIVTTNGDPQLGVIALGTRLDITYGLDIGFEPPNLGVEYEDENNIAQNGLFLGRTIRKTPIDFAIQTSLVPLSWNRTYWKPFLDHAVQRPFFFSWSGNKHASEVVYAWSTKRPQSAPFSKSDYVTLNLPCQGVFTS